MVQKIAIVIIEKVIIFLYGFFNSLKYINALIWGIYKYITSFSCKLFVLFITVLSLCEWIREICLLHIKKRKYFCKCLKLLN
jgi:fumarate reductase subunit D